MNKKKKLFFSMQNKKKRVRESFKNHHQQVRNSATKKKNERKPVELAVASKYIKIHIQRVISLNFHSLK